MNQFHNYLLKTTLLQELSGFEDVFVSETWGGATFFVS
jgi:hypothetical protein